MTTTPTLTSGTLYGRKTLRRSLSHIGATLALTAAELSLAALLYPAVAWVYRDERRQAGAR